MSENSDPEDLSGSSSSEDSPDCDSDCNVDSLNAPQIESLESVEPNYSDSDRDTFPDCFGTDVKIQPLKIMKININCFRDITTSKSDNLQQVKSMINMMVRNKSLSADDVNEPPKKNPRLATADNVMPSSAAVKSFWDNVYRKELHLKPGIEAEFTDAGIPFRLKCFLFQKSGNTALTKTFMKLVAPKSKEILRTKEQTINSYLVFFYRIIQDKPEVFVLFVGFARKLVLKFAEKDFTGKVERRLLQFPFHQVEYRRESGPVYKRTDVARQGQNILFDVWDFLDNIVGNRTRQLRDDSSLYAEGLLAFLSDAGEPLPIKVDVKEKSLIIRRSLTLAQIGSTLIHFSKISSGHETYKYNISRKEELDTPEFKMHDYLSKVTSRRLRKDLNRGLYKMMERCMLEHKKTFIYLTHKHFTWDKAEQITLHVRKPDKKRRSKVKEWDSPPSLDEVLDCIKTTCGSRSFDPEWLSDVQLKFDGKLYPLKDFIFTRHDFGEVGSYIYYFGTWLEMTADYLYLMERYFTQLLSDKLEEKAESIPLLPWKVVQGDKSGIKSSARQYKLPPFDFQDEQRSWSRHFKTFNGLYSFKDVENVMVGSNLVQKDSAGKILTNNDLIINDNICSEEPCSVAARLYLLHECRLTEEDYNASHALFNRILRNEPVKMITCDRIEPHGIELCDILIWKGNTTYLVHVKSGFTGSAIREVCSQIRNSADHIYREQTSTKGTGMIGAFWNSLTSDSQNGYHKEAACEILKKMGYDQFKDLFQSKRDIIFVLACRDDRKRDFKEDIDTPFRRNFMVNMEEEIAENLHIDDRTEVITKLKEEKYLNEKGNLTNKFILDGKDNKTKFIEHIKDWDVIGNQKNAQALFDILMSGLSRSKSTIAKMEIIRLCRDFERYSVREKQFQLKITSIAKQF